jgi:hypothetical protein
VHGHGRASRLLASGQSREYDKSRLIFLTGVTIMHVGHETRQWRASHRLCGLAVLALGWLSTAAVAGTTNWAAKAAETEELDEVQVLGKKLYQMRDDIIAAEKLFYARYNELNTNNDFDVSCSMAAQLGTHLLMRRCSPLFYAKAREAEASAAIGGYYAPEAELVLLERWDDFRQHALSVINRDAQLRRLIRNRERMEQIFVKAKAERMKGRLILFE